MAKIKTKTKKGPKGKKARQQAKLQRQWGETAKKEPKMRTGKHRLKVTSNMVSTKSDRDPMIAAMSQGIDQKQPPPNDIHRRIHNDTDDEQDDTAGQLSTKDFLHQLRQQQRSRTSSMDSSSASSMESSAASLIQEDETDDKESNQDQLTISFNMTKDDHAFRQRFQTHPIPEDQVDQYLERTHETVKMAHVTGQDAELVLSKTFLQEHKLSVLFDFKQWKDMTIQASTTPHSALGNGSLRLSPLAQVVWPLMRNYMDILVTCEQLSHQQMQKLVLRHILQHVMTTRKDILAHNGLPPNDDDDGSNHRRDQGFTRPTVLVLLPTRGTCHEFVHQLRRHVAAMPPDQQMERFDAEFGPPPAQPVENEVQKHRQKALERKGKEWNALFGDDVNDDDDFKLGLSISMPNKNRHAAIRLYTDFYKSDIIVASPLGLKIFMDSKKEETDFLSSIEICHVARADVLLMQNWDHVDEVLASLNQRPVNTNETDFSRIRPYFLSDQAKHWRQLILSGRFVDPHILSAFKKYAKNHSGVARLRVPTRMENASISRVVLPIRQVFQRVHVTSIAHQSEERLSFFEEKVLPQIISSKQHHTLIFIPSYFDYVYVRNLFLRKELDFCSVTEYARTTEVNRGRARFLQGRKPILLYTGRAHYFLRHEIKGARHLIFYGLPEHAPFYHDHVNLLGEGLDDDADRTASTFVLFSKYDAHALERVVGASHASRMIQGEKTTFLLSS